MAIQHRHRSVLFHLEVRKITTIFILTLFTYTFKVSLGIAGRKSRIPPLSIIMTQNYCKGVLI